MTVVMPLIFDDEMEELINELEVAEKSIGEIGQEDLTLKEQATMIGIVRMFKGHKHFRAFMEAVFVSYSVAASQNRTTELTLKYRRATMEVLKGD